MKLRQSQLPFLQAAKLLAINVDVVQPPQCSLKVETCTIGRAIDCHIVVKRKIVSRYHARIERQGEGYVLFDLNSANGTYVNENRISGPHLLKNDDVIGLGGTEALLRFNDPDPTEQVSSSLLRYDEQHLIFFLGQEPLDLTPSQFRLLLHLYNNAGQVCTRESCADAIWGPDYDPGLAADAFDKVISKLRGKLQDRLIRIGPIATTTPFIKTYRGQGYKLVL